MVDRIVLESLIKDILAEQQPVPQPSVWEKIKNKLSEQGSQRGIFAIIPFIATQLHFPAEDMVAILTFFLGVMGVHNFITEG
jgi:hypothetical protein